MNNQPQPEDPQNPQNPDTTPSHLEQATGPPLPPHWERTVGANGEIYFANHQDRTTTFRHPVTGEGEPNLKYANGTGRAYWVDHVSKTTRWAVGDEEWSGREGRGENIVIGNVGL